jgi:hypothetical protein
MSNTLRMGTHLALSAARFGWFCGINRLAFPSKVMVRRRVQ